jgi:hypothetical protein
LRSIQGQSSEISTLRSKAEIRWASLRGDVAPM